MALFDTSEIQKNFKFSSGEADSEHVVKIADSFSKLDDTIGELFNGKTVHFVTNRAWSMYELFEYCIRKTGRARADCFTWNISMSAVNSFFALIGDGLLYDLRILCNNVMQRFIAEAISVLQSKCKRLILYPNHAKGFLIENEKFKITCVGSANFSNNPQIECGVITLSPAAFEMHSKWLNQLFEDKTLDSSNRIENRKIPDPKETGKHFFIFDTCDEGIQGGIGTRAFCDNDFFRSIFGEFTFDKTRIPQAKNQCWNNVKMAMENGEKAISVCNDFKGTAEIERYKTLGEEFGYSVHVLKGAKK